MQTDVVKCIAPHSNSIDGQGDMDRVLQVFVAPFDERQTRTFVGMFAASSELSVDQWTAAKYTEVLAANPDVKALAESPLMLFMVLTILPLIDNQRKVHGWRRLLHRIRPICGRR